MAQKEKFHFSNALPQLMTLFAIVVLLKRKDGFGEKEPLLVSDQIGEQLDSRRSMLAANQDHYLPPDPRVRIISIFPQILDRFGSLHLIIHFAKSFPVSSFRIQHSRSDPLFQVSS